MQMVFVKDLDSVVEWVLGKFTGNTKLGGVVDMLKGRAAILNGKGTDRNLMKFNENKCHILHLGWKTSLQLYGLGTAQLESSFLGKDMGVLVGNKLNMNEQCVLAAKKSKYLLHSISKSAASKTQEV